MRVLLLSTYDLGHQPFGLASPTSWLTKAGHEVRCVDLAVDPAGLADEFIEEADLIGFYLPMHTATRLAIPLVKRVRRTNQRAHICFYGLYAAMNENLLRELGASSVLSGEFESQLTARADELERGVGNGYRKSEVLLPKQQFEVPDRRGLPGLERYARLRLEREEVAVGYTEASRGCKHFCRHCPIVPVYNGRFRVVQPEVVLEDVRRQVGAGARHITFGDPDFFNGPAHAVRIVEAMSRDWPGLTYDVTIKVEHLIRHAPLLGILKSTGCLFVTTAVESLDERTLEVLDKGHRPADFLAVVELFRRLDLQLNPTFVTFTPWTTVQSYLEFVRALRDLDLVDNVAPVQYAIRLLIPAGSRLLELTEIRELVGPFSKQDLVFPWTHPDPDVDALFQGVKDDVVRGQRAQEPRSRIFDRIWNRVRSASALPADDGAPRERRPRYVPYS
jgi:radical SAM superfamily enzyme YgiQ (UPF0313 family)